LVKVEDGKIILTDISRPDIVIGLDDPRAFDLAAASVRDVIYNWSATISKYRV